ncbi:MAG: molecular chaperone HtpG [Sandaracinaceae bacterium]
MTEEKTTHRFEAEVEQVLRLVIHSLYSNREVFLRELLSNASDALDKLRFRSLTDKGLRAEDEELEVRLEVDAEAGTLAVADNGIGMTRDELIENLGTVARSGSRDFLKKLEEAQAGDVSLIGQFGVGFYSAWLVADRVEVTSRAAGAEEAFRWVSEAQGTFTVEPAERESQGTTVLLHLAEDHRSYLEPHRIRQLVERYSDYLSFPIRLKAKDGKLQPLNRGTALWQRPKQDVDDDQLKELYHHLSGDFRDPLAWRHFKLEGTQVFAGVVYLPSEPPFDLFHPEAKHGMRLYVKRVFILDDAEELLPRWLRFIRGVVDSEDLPLNVSREVLQDSRVVAFLRKQVVKQVLDMLGELADERADDYATFWSSFGAVLKEGLHLEPTRRDDIVPLLRFRTSEHDGLSSLSEVKDRMKEGQDAIPYILGESVAQVTGSPHLEALRKAGIEVLYLTDPVDPFAVPGLGSFDGVPLRSVTEGGFDIGEAGAAEVDEERDAALKDLKDRIRARLQEHVSEVRSSARLTDSPVCLVIAEGGLQPHLERILRSAQQDLPVQKRILEVNPEHPVIENLRRLLADGQDDTVDEWVDLLFDQARIAEGTPLEDPGAFSRRLTKLMEAASGQLVGADGG